MAFPRSDCPQNDTRCDGNFSGKSNYNNFYIIETNTQETAAKYTARYMI